MNSTNLDILDDDISGGPAAPCFAIVTHDTGDVVKNADQGLSKRDAFALGADPRLTMSMAIAIMDGHNPPENVLANAKWWALAEARLRYIKADAMMEARK